MKLLRLIIKDYIRERERCGREVFVPLAHPPGDAQADFGEAVVILDGVEQKAHFFVLDLPHSDASFVRTYSGLQLRGIAERAGGIRVNSSG